MNKLISFALWGTKKIYNEGIFENITLAKKHYPGWGIRVYCDESSPVIDKLARVCEVVPFEAIKGNGVLEGSFCWTNLFKRYKPVQDPSVDICIFRDADSRLSAKEAIAVKQWIDSGKALHVMHGHPAHYRFAVLSGAWGIRSGWLPKFDKMVECWCEAKDVNFVYEKLDAVDELFLSEVIWPMFRFGNYLGHGVHWEHNIPPFGDNEFLFPDDQLEQGQFVGDVVRIDGDQPEKVKKDSVLNNPKFVEPRTLEKPKSLSVVSVNFFHGLGDACNFAHQIPLYLKRGYEVHVECTHDKAVIFQSAGAKITHRAEKSHGWNHAPGGNLNQINHWVGSKSAWNISQDPMPKIGSVSDLWNEYCEVSLNLDDFVSGVTKKTIEEYLEPLPRPIVLFHSQGNTGTDQKNLSHDHQRDVVLGLMDNTEGTVILLDWDSRVWKAKGYRIRHLSEDWKGLSIIESYQLMKSADLMIGIDSGPLHLSRFTDVPAIGVWTHHHPSHYVLPKSNSINVVGTWANSTTKFRRMPFNIVESTDKNIDGKFILDSALRMLNKPKYISPNSADAVLRSLISKCRGIGCGIGDNIVVDRNISFDMALRFLKENPTIVETGCIRSEEDWSAGYSTYIFGYFLKYFGGKLISVDLSENSCKFAKIWTQNMPVEVVCKHSHDFFRSYNGDKINLLYLDSLDTNEAGHEENCLEEIKLAFPFLAERSAVLIDDTPWQKGKWYGKGTKAIPWLLEKGFKIKYAGYQVLLVRDNEKLENLP